jgi:methanogenic corrinoid protein MtbC1
MAGTTQEDANTARMAGEYWSESGSPPRPSPQPVSRSAGELVFPTADWMGDLARTIEAEIIPRLMLAHGGQDSAAAAISCESRAPSSPEVVEFANLVLAQDAMVARTWVEAVRARGASPETIFLELLAPAARRLGELWEADLCDFTQVTLGLWRIQQVVHELAPSFRNDVQFTQGGRRVLLSAAPGDQHTLGLLMVAEFFRHSGWEVCAGASGRSLDLVQAVQTERFDVLGFSVGSEARLEALKRLIAAVRGASSNPDLIVMVGGPIFVEHPEWVALVGADATATDAKDAVRRADEMVPLRCTQG